MRWEDRTEINKLKEKIRELEYGFSLKKLLGTPQFYSSIAAIVALILAGIYGNKEALIEIQTQRLELVKAKFIQDTTRYAAEINAIKDSTAKYKANLQKLKVKTAKLEKLNDIIFNQNQNLQSNRVALRDQLAQNDPILTNALNASARYSKLIVETESYLIALQKIDAVLMEIYGWDLDQKEKSIKKLEKELKSIKTPNKDIQLIISLAINELGDFKGGRPLDRKELTALLKNTSSQLNQTILIKLENAKRSTIDDQKNSQYNFDIPFADTIK